MHLREGGIGFLVLVTTTGTGHVEICKVNHNPNMSCCAGEYWDDTDEVEGHDGIAPDDDKTPMTALVELILRAVQNALIYGYRVRFLHTLTYQIAGIKSSIGFIDLLKKIWKSIKLGVDHGKILAFYAIVYRSSLMLTKKLRNFEYNRDLLNHFIAGFAGGIFIYGGVLQKLLKKQSLNEKTKPCCQTGKLAPAPSSSLSTLIENILGLNESIVTQITLYTVSRLVLALGRDLGRIVSEKSTSHRGEGHVSNTKKDNS